jgi:hypothetical protein
VGKFIVNVPPGGIKPDSQAPLLPVDVCVVVSLLRHVTLPPTDTVIGSGAYAFVVSVDAPLTIETDEPDGEGDGEGEGADGEDDPQPIDTPSTNAARKVRALMGPPPLASANFLPERGGASGPVLLENGADWTSPHYANSKWLSHFVS